MVSPRCDVPTRTTTLAHHTNRSPPMTTVDLAALYPVDDDDITRLRTRLAVAADRDDLLDVAYRTVDSPVGSLLIASTPVRLVRMAFINEGHHAVLQNLSDR